MHVKPPKYYLKASSLVAVRPLLIRCLYHHSETNRKKHVCNIYASVKLDKETNIAVEYCYSKI